MKFPVRILAILALLMTPWVQAAPTDTRTLQVAGASEKRVALVIGNSAYAQGPLKNPVNDARAIKARLQSLGFEVILRENLKTKEISGVYQEFRNKITPGGVALVFYAGHGVQFKGQNFFPAVDSDINFEEDVPLQSLNLGNLLDSMEEAKAGVSLVFLDACRDNPFAKRFRSASRGLAKVESASGTLIHYATKPGSVAADGDGMNGTYTEALLAQIGEAGVPVEIMLKKVTNRVAQRTGGKQEPWVEGSLRGEFYFIFQGPTTVNVQQAPTDPDSAAWQAADSLGTLPAYEAYLKEYPKGRHAAAARIKIGALKPGARPAAVTPAPAVAATDPETAFWNEVKQSGTREYLDAYLKQYPKGKFAALAKVELKKLDDREQQEKTQAEQEAWDQARTAHTPAAYEAYLQRYPKGSYAALAEAAKQKAQRDLDDVALQAARKAEDELWQKAKAAEDSPTVQGYLDRYPSGRYVAEARTKLVVVKKAEAEMKPGKVFKDCPECPEMVVIPAGSFQMGSNNGDDDEKPVHGVNIARPFALGKTEVTQGQWRAIMGNNPSHFTACGDDCPVEQVNWNDAQEFVRKLSQMTGKRYRLPSEAEWEYACKAGNAHKYCGGESAEIVAWYYDNSRGKANPVALKQPNAWGLFDMSGNSLEWVADCYDSYKGAPADGSARSFDNCGMRVLRGGSRNESHQYITATRRYGYNPSERSHYGLRPARMLP